MKLASWHRCWLWFGDPTWLRFWIVLGWWWGALGFWRDIRKHLMHVQALVWSVVNMPVQIDHLHPCIVFCLKQCPDSSLAVEAKKRVRSIGLHAWSSDRQMQNSFPCLLHALDEAADRQLDNRKIAENFLFVFTETRLQHTMQLLLQLGVQNTTLSISFNEPCWYVGIPLVILIFIMLSRSIICSKFRIAYQFQLFPFWMIQPNEIWTNPTNKSPMQTAKIAAVQVYNDDRTVIKQSKPAAKIEWPEKKLASAKIASAKMQRKFPYKNANVIESRNQASAWLITCWSVRSPA